MMLRPIWNKIFKFNWQFGLFLILLLGVPRIILVLRANETGNYNLLPVIFILMWLFPFIFLTRKGRRTIGIRKPKNYKWIIISFLTGILYCIIMFAVAKLIYQQTISNWFVYISNSYKISKVSLSATDRLIYFGIYGLIGMTFSPIGEELFYRGIVHTAFIKRFGETKASVIDSLAFSLTHLAHFGIIYSMGHWEFRLLPALLWVLFMFLVSRLFFFCKNKTGSLLGAIGCHAGYNVMMMYFIIYHVL